MLDTVAMEFKKLKKNTIVRLTFLGNMVPPVLYFLIYLNQKSNGYAVTLNDMLSQTSAFNFIFFGILIYSLISSYIFSREYEDDTLKSLLSIPVSRNKVITSKLVVISMEIFSLVAISYVSCVLFSVLGRFEGISYEIILKYMASYVKGYLATLPLMPSIIFVTFLFKKYIPAMIFAIVMSTVNIAIVSSKYAQLFPFTIPYTFIENAKYKDYSPVISYLILAVTCLVTLFLAFWYFSREDI